MGHTVTLEPGAQATVTNSGTDSDVILNFGIPRGADGAGGNLPEGTLGDLLVFDDGWKAKDPADAIVPGARIGDIVTVDGSGGLTPIPPDQLILPGWEPFTRNTSGNGAASRITSGYLEGYYSLKQMPSIALPEGYEYAGVIGRYTLTPETSDTFSVPLIIYGMTLGNRQPMITPGAYGKAWTSRLHNEYEWRTDPGGNLVVKIPDGVSPLAYWNAKLNIYCLRRPIKS